jgi:hypothetical protein
MAGNIRTSDGRRAIGDRRTRLHLALLTWLFATQIPTVQPAQPPYALAATAFRFPALAALAGRSAIGGQREVALATYLTARLAQDTLPERGVSPEARMERAANAKNWLATLSLPAAVRPALARLVELSAGSPEFAAQGVRNVTAVTANFLDSGARLELDQLAASLAAQALAG